MDKWTKGSEKLLGILRKESGKVVSGAVLGSYLGVSRTAVWKQVNRLRERGYRIESIRSEGYRFVSAPDMLLSEEIWNGLKTIKFARRVRSLESTDSTNRVASDLAGQGAEEGELVIADTQTRARGRLGRSWISPPKSNLYFSIILRPSITPAAISQITLMTAVSLSESLTEQTGLPVRIKWPNDLWVNGKKVGGILTEMSADMDRVRHVILGMGVNINMPPEAFPHNLKGIATSLSIEAGQTFSRVSLLQGLLAALEKDYLLFCKHGFQPFRERWIKASIILGHPVHVRMPHREIRGKALGINDQGYLQVETEAGVVEDVVSGDVSMREQYKDKQSTV
jgi:BirA family biotin operon repressor/biotin-[acetyl-CoA-carboxylase] ligase